MQGVHQLARARRRKNIGKHSFFSSSRTCKVRSVTRFKAICFDVGRRFRAVLGSLGSALGQPWGRLGSVLRRLGASRVVLGARLSPSWRLPAPSWGPLEVSWGSGDVFGGFSGAFLACFACFAA